MKLVLKNTENNKTHEFQISSKKMNDETLFKNRINAAKTAWASFEVRKEWVDKGILKDTDIKNFILTEKEQKEFNKELEKKKEKMLLVEKK